MSEPDPYLEARLRMVEEQLSSHRPLVTNPRVLETMRHVPRHEFVPPESRSDSYGDHPIPIGYGQTISQPYIVALMTEQLDPQPEDRVLEIGTGSAYQAAVLADLVKDVYSIEVVPELGERARDILSRLKYGNIHLRIGDGYLGWEEAAPFDSIIVTCAPDHIPQPLTEQLKNGGKMLIPVGAEGDIQELYLLKKENGKIRQNAILKVRFVPMTGKSQS